MCLYLICDLGRRGAQLGISRGFWEVFIHSCIHPRERMKRQRSEFQEELVAVAWETRRLLGGLASTSLDSSWGFLPECGFGLARVWIL